MDRWCLCEHCIEAIRSRGFEVLSRPMESRDCTEEEWKTEVVECNYCHEDYTPNEMYVCG